jgi:hypothetical protein
MAEPTQQTFSWQRPGGSLGSGMVTSPGLIPPPAPPPDDSPPPPDGPARRRRQMMIFAWAAGGIFAVGLVIVLVVALSTDGAPFRGQAKGPADLRPPLAQACPAPTGSPTPEVTRPPASLPPETGQRTVDKDAGISYKAYGPPWEPWDDVWRAGSLEVPYKVGQHFVTEIYSGGTYHASILSAAVPAADNDAVTLDLACVGRQVAADVRASYYPQPNTLDEIRDGLTTLGGRPAYVNEFRLHFHAQGLTATDELSAVAVIDVGKPTAAVLYVSIPGTHKQYDYVVEDVLKSVRPL